MNRRATTRALVAAVGSALLAASGWAGSAEGVAQAAAPAMQTAVNLEAPPATVVPAATGLLGSMAPHRIFDSRKFGALAPGEQRYVCDTVGRIPLDAAGVVLNLTVVSPTAAGYLTAWSDGTAPAVSNLNFAARTVTSNLVVLELGPVQCITVRNSSKGSTHLLLDVQGYLTKGPATAPATTQTVYPSRLLDTRTTRVSIPGHGSLEVPVMGHGTVPASGVGAAWLNLTVTGGTAPGWLTAYATGEPRPTTASLNFGTAETRAGLTLAKLGAGGRTTIYNGSSKPVHLVVDAFGWVRSGDGSRTLAGIMPVSPNRVLDTRRDVPVAGGGEVGVNPPAPPTGASAAILAVTAVDATAPGYLVVSEVNGSGGASAVNFVPGKATTNLVVARRDGFTVVRNGAAGPVDVVVDVVGWVTAERAVGGRVVDISGNGIANASVYAGVLEGYVGRSTNDGSYDLPLPASFSRVTPCAQLFASGNFPDHRYAPGCHRSWTNRTTYTLGLGQRLTGADIPLEPATTVRGTATDFAGAPLTSGTVTLRRAGDDRRYGATISNGSWAVGNVALGDYYVALDGPASATTTPFGLAPEWYPDVQPGPGTSAAMAAAGAQAVAVTASAPSSLDLVAEARAKVSGTLASGNPAAPLSTSARAQLLRANGTVFATAAMTAGTSSWATLVHPGTLKACAYRVSGQSSYCWEGDLPVDQATPITVTPAQESGGIAITLP